MPLWWETEGPGSKGTEHDAYSARIRLFLGLCSTSARCRASKTGGTYMPNRPRSPFFRPYHPPTGFFGDRPQASTRTVRCWLLLVCAPQEHPVAVGLEHLMQVVDAPEVVAQLRAPRLHDERGRVQRLVTERLKLRRPARRLQVPR